MKISAVVSAVVFACGLLAQGGAFAAESDVKAKSAVYEPGADSAQVIKTAAPIGCQGASCAEPVLTNSCGAYVSSGKRYGYGFDMGRAAAISKARAMCGQGDSCQVVVAACEE
ncbi:MAG TPA: hypothetical protein VGN52_02550 [Burkholderiales bacterium]